MDSDLIRHRAALMADVLRGLRAMLQLPDEGSGTEVMRRWAVERSLLLLVEYAAEINAEAASGAGIPPSDYYSSFFSASRAGWLPQELAVSLAALVPLRNQILHACQNVEAVDGVSATLPAWEQYVESILGRLESPPG